MTFENRKNIFRVNESMHKGKEGCTRLSGYDYD
jgi:hypothetical protein